MDAGNLQSDMVHRYLREQLRSGTFRFGEEVSTYVLAQRLAIGRRPVLEAIKRLEVEGFVRIIPRVGCRVISPTVTEVIEHFLISAGLEGICAELAALRALPSQVEWLEQIWRSARPAVDAGDVAAYAEHNRAFHAGVLEISGNQELQRLLPPLWDLNDFYLLGTGKFSEIVERSYQEHGLVLHALLNRDTLAARTTMENHVRGMTRNLQTYFQRG